MDTVCRYFIESWKIFTAYATITDGIFPARFFFVRIFFCKTIGIFFPNRISDRMWNYQWTLCRQTISVGDLVGKKFTDELAILHRQIRSVGKTVKCCSVKRSIHKTQCLTYINYKNIWLLMIFWICEACCSWCMYLGGRTYSKYGVMTLNMILMYQIKYSSFVIIWYISINISFLCASHCDT
jgi:hypothetical protein